MNCCTGMFGSSLLATAARLNGRWIHTTPHAQRLFVPNGCRRWKSPRLRRWYLAESLGSCWTTWIAPRRGKRLLLPWDRLPSLYREWIEQRQAMVEAICSRFPASQRERIREVAKRNLTACETACGVSPKGFGYCGMMIRSGKRSASPTAPWRWPCGRADPMGHPPPGGLFSWPSSCWLCLRRWTTGTKTGGCWI